MSASSMVGEMLRGCVQVLFPPSCVHCRKPVEDESPFRLLCKRCSRGVHYARPPCCTVCGHPFFGEMVEDQCCPHCTSLVPAFCEGRTAVLYRGVVRSLVLELKYHRGTQVAEDLEVIFSNATELLDYVRGATLVPVPLHPRKERERGYNQTRLIAEALRKASGDSVDIQWLLKRSLDSSTQTAFGREARAANMKNAFALAAGASIKPGHRYILLDDIFTTGATLNTCAHVLSRAGCLKVDIVTLAHG